MEGRFNSIGVEVNVEVFCGTTTKEEIMAMLTNLEEAIMNYVKYDSVSSGIASLNLYRVGPLTWRIGAIIDVPEPEPPFPESS